MGLPVHATFDLKVIRRRARRFLCTFVMDKIRSPDECCSELRVVDHPLPRGRCIEVASRSRVRHSALPVALRRHEPASQNPAALWHARLTQSGHVLTCPLTQCRPVVNRRAKFRTLQPEMVVQGAFTVQLLRFVFAETRVRHRSVASWVSCQNYGP